MSLLFIDTVAGLTGREVVGALCALGVKPSSLEWELSKPELGPFHLHVDRAGEALRFGIHTGATHTHDQDEAGEEEGCCGGHHHHDHGEEEHHDCGHDHDHDHEHHDCGHDHDHHEGECCHDHGHEHEEACEGHDHHDAHHEPSRSLAQVQALIHGAGFDETVLAGVLAVLERIAAAEAALAGVALQEAQLHEAGRLETLAGAIAAIAGAQELGVTEWLAAPLRGEKGALSPLVVAILESKGITIEPGPQRLTLDPLGAALLAEVVTRFEAGSAITAEKLGYGAGAHGRRLALILGR